MRINPEALRALIQKDGYSVSSFATKVGIERSHLSNVLAGRRGASAAVVKAMAETLDVPMSAITSLTTTAVA
jgi:transcriptional regulator with XRE-family HTH domain